MDSLCIVMPAYNEKSNIESVVEQWYPIVEKYNGNGRSRLVVIDDGSKDDTYKIICELSKNMPLLVPMTKVNGGHGSTVLSGYRYALEKEFDWVFQTDSDGQTNPEEFELFWEQREKYDAIIGDRQATREDGFSRVLVENVLRLIIKIIFGNLDIPDANAPFRLMKRELVGKYIEKMPVDYNLPNVMLTTYFVYYNEKIKFEKISFAPRRGGENSINVPKICMIGWKALGDFIALRRSM